MKTIFLLSLLCLSSQLLVTASNRKDKALKKALKKKAPLPSLPVDSPDTWDERTDGPMPKEVKRALEKGGVLRTVGKRKIVVFPKDDSRKDSSPSAKPGKDSPEDPSTKSKKNPKAKSEKPSLKPPRSSQTSSKKTSPVRRSPLNSSPLPDPWVKPRVVPFQLFVCLLKQLQ